MSDCIVCLVGRSGSGKTTIAYKLHDDFGYNIIESYTTRPPRYEGEKGHTFVENLPLPIKNWAMNDDVIAFNIYNDNAYWATRKQYQGKGVSIYVVDIVGANMLRNKVDDADILVIALFADEFTRYDRLWERETGKLDKQSQTHKTLREIDDEIDQRVKSDRPIFSMVPCDYAIDANYSVPLVASMISSIIYERRCGDA